MVIALADRYAVGPLPLKGREFRTVKDAKALRVYSNVTTVVECNKYLVLDEVEL